MATRILILISANLLCLAAHSQGLTTGGDRGKFIKGCKELAEQHGAGKKCGNIPEPRAEQEIVVNCGDSKMRIALKNLPQKSSDYGAHVACTVILDNEAKGTKEASIARNFHKGQNESINCSPVYEWTHTNARGKQTTSSECSNFIGRQTANGRYDLFERGPDGKETKVVGGMTRKRYVTCLKTGKGCRGGEGDNQGASGAATRQ